MLKSLPRISHLAAAGMAFAAALAAPVSAEEPVLNLYSSRHYQTDDALYAAKNAGRDCVRQAEPPAVVLEVVKRAN